MGAEQVDVPNDPFCVGIERALKASLSLDPRLDGIGIQFVRGGEMDIDLLFTKEHNLLRVHEKWIDFHKIHEGTDCEIFEFVEGREELTDTEPFSCDHVVEELFELAINQVGPQLELDQNECRDVQRQARTRIRQTPRLIKLRPTSQANELEVSWTGNESGIVSQQYAADIMFHVTLHTTRTCELRRHELFRRAGKYLSKDYLVKCLVLIFKRRFATGGGSEPR